MICNWGRILFWEILFQKHGAMGILQNLYKNERNVGFPSLVKQRTLSLACLRGVYMQFKVSIYILKTRLFYFVSCLQAWGFISVMQDYVFEVVYWEIHSKQAANFKWLCWYLIITSYWRGHWTLIEHYIRLKVAYVLSKHKWKKKLLLNMLKGTKSEVLV